MEQEAINSALIAAVAAIFSALLTVSVQYLYSRRAEARRSYRDLQAQAYVDFLKAVAGITIAQRPATGDKEREVGDKELEARVLLTDAKARIAMYGSARVAAAVAAFFRDHGALNSEPALKSFTDLVLLMRADGPAAAHKISPEQMRHLLFS